LTKGEFSVIGGEDKSMANDLEGRMGEARVPPTGKPPVPTGKPPVISHEQTEFSPPAPVSTPKPPDTTKHAFPLLGSNFGGVQVIENLKKGGMADVYKGIDIETGIPVIFKALKPEFYDQAEAKKRFLQDAESTSRLKHSHIVETLRHGEHSGIPYIVYKEIPGVKDLSEFLKPGSDIIIGLEDSVNIAIQTSEALMYSHSEGIVHRDFKPGNVLYNPITRIAILIDYGIAKSQDEAMTQARQPMGTLSYMAPEQAQDSSTVTGAADLYSWGCVLYELLSRTTPNEKKTNDPNHLFTNRKLTEVPFEHWLNDAIEIRRNELSEQLKNEKDPFNKQKIQSLLEVVVPVSDDLEDLVMMVMNAKNPKDRPPFYIVAQRLHDLASGNGLLRSIYTDEDKRINAEKQKKFEEVVKKNKEDLAKISDKEAEKKNVATLFLARSLEALAEATPRSDDARAAYAHESFECYSKVQSALQLRKRAGDTTLEEIDDAAAWMSAFNNNEQTRKHHRETKVLERELVGVVKDAEEAFKKNDIAGLSKTYGVIPHSRVPLALKHRIDALTLNIEQAVLSALTSGLTANAEGNLDTAKDNYRIASVFSDMLPDSSKDTKDKVGKFHQTLQTGEIRRLMKEYESAKGNGDHFGMYVCAERIGECAKDLPLEISGTFKKTADDYMKKLEGHEDDIRILIGLKKSTKELRDKYDAELASSEKEISSNGQGQTGLALLPEERVNDYLTKVNDKIQKFESSVKKEKIGPEYDKFKQTLADFVEDVKAEQYALHLGTGDFAARAETFFNLILHHHRRGNGPKERMYITGYKALLTDREKQIPSQ